MLKFLGRGSAFNVKEGNTSAYYIEESTLYLFDCGEDVFPKIIPLLDEKIEKVVIFISHINSDHCGSLSSLLFYLFYKTKIEFEVFSGVDTYLDLKKLLKLQGNEKQLDKIYILKEDSSIKVNHIDNMGCYGFCFSINNKYIYYSGDSNEIPEEILINLDKIDYLYQDTCLADYEGNVHLSLRRLCELIPIEHRHKVWCMHLDCDELIEKSKTEGFNVVEVDFND